MPATAELTGVDIEFDLVLDPSHVRSGGRLSLRGVLRLWGTVGSEMGISKRRRLAG